MTRTGIRVGHRPRLIAIACLALAAAWSTSPAAASAAGEPATMVLEWNAYAVAALSNANNAVPPTPVGAGQTPPVASQHLAMVQLAVYDAVNAIAGKRAAYLDNVPSASRSASKAAAAATAAHHVLVGLVPSLPQNVKDWLNPAYDASIASLPSGADRNAGVAIGAAVAELMLDEREDDGRYTSFTFTTGTGNGEWRPTSGVNDPFAWVAKVRPFSLNSASQLRTEGPLALSSPEYAAEYDEVKSLGALNNSTRTDAQTALARFVTGNPAVYMNRGLRDIAVAEGLSITGAARLFAMSSSASADALISCWDNKEYWGFWRPVTAIQAGDDDGNPWTTGQSGWLPFFTTPPYPDEPSGYNCFTAGVWHSAKAFFGTDMVSFTLTSPTGIAPRDYDRFSDVVRDTIEGRIYTGFHFRTADVNGAWIGKKAAQWVAKHEFELLE